MCRVLGIARAAFYKWFHQPLSAGAIENQRVLTLIRDSYTASGGVCRVLGDLREAGAMASIGWPSPRITRKCGVLNYAVELGIIERNPMPALRRFIGTS